MAVVKKAAALAAAAAGVVVVGAGAASAAEATGSATDSPGVGSGNLVQVPVHAAFNVVGNTVTGIGGLNPTTGNMGTNV